MFQNRPKLSRRNCGVLALVHTHYLCTLHRTHTHTVDISFQMKIDTKVISSSSTLLLYKEEGGGTRKGSRRKNKNKNQTLNSPFFSLLILTHRFTLLVYYRSLHLHLDSTKMTAGDKKLCITSSTIFCSNEKKISIFVTVKTHTHNVIGF